MTSNGQHLDVFGCHGLGNKIIEAKKWCVRTIRKHGSAFIVDFDIFALSDLEKIANICFPCDLSKEPFDYLELNIVKDCYARKFYNVVGSKYEFIYEFECVRLKDADS